MASNRMILNHLQSDIVNHLSQMKSRRETMEYLNKIRNSIGEFLFIETCKPLVIDALKSPDFYQTIPDEIMETFRTFTTQLYLNSLKRPPEAPMPERKFDPIITEYAQRLVAAFLNQQKQSVANNSIFARTNDESPAALVRKLNPDAADFIPMSPSHDDSIELFKPQFSQNKKGLK